MMQNRLGPEPGDTRNLILAIALSMIVMFGFDYFFVRPQRTAAEAERQAAAVQQQQQAPEAPAERTPDEAVADTRAQRVPVATPTLAGSILLAGARIDDLSLTQYHRTIDRESPSVTLLAPRGAVGGADAFFGWEARDGASALADTSSLWTAPAGARLTPETPLTLTLAADGIEITRVISVDARSMLTIEDRVRNMGDRPRELRPYGVARRQNKPLDYVQNPIVHQGMTGVFGPEQRLHEVRFQTAETHAKDKTRGRKGDEARILELQGRGGWLGLSDHYWLTALIPDQREEIDGFYDSRNETGFTDFRAAYRGAWRTLQPDSEIVYTQRLFAGAKTVEVLQDYQKTLQIPDFDKAVDWGNFWFLTRPFFSLLHYFGTLVGNFGLGILLTTVVVKLVLFPLVYQSNVAMTKLRKLQPKMQEIQQRFAADKPRQQQEMIRLYQTEKINPVAGCVPILLQIPVFFSLYKVLTVTIEMRHAPFFGWIHDLSARDSSNIFSLFGLLPAIGVPFPDGIPLLGQFLHLGAFPIAYGLSMWALQALSPPPTDPTQAAIFRWLPIIFTFMFAGFAIGMVIYWTWSNTLSIIQQYVIMRRMGVETELDKWIAKRLAQAKKDSAPATPAE
ncbi:MAG: membrane protein insertase YidC [Hyphomonadaceae bacterium]|nr:membrane protein insertase YidC [Hyphomonadaceae bacterium]